MNLYKCEQSKWALVFNSRVTISWVLWFAYVTVWFFVSMVIRLMCCTEVTELLYFWTVVAHTKTKEQIKPPTMLKIKSDGWYGEDFFSSHSLSIFSYDAIHVLPAWMDSRCSTHCPHIAMIGVQNQAKQPPIKPPWWVIQTQPNGLQITGIWTQ